MLVMSRVANVVPHVVQVSGCFQQFPEIDTVAWLDLPAARAKIVNAQQAFLDRLADHLAIG